LLLLLLIPVASSGYVISSYALVQDNASLRIRGKTIHLYGIYVPPTGRICRSTIRPTRCAQRAALALDFKIGANFVRCSPKRKNPDRSLVAVCSVKGQDLGAYLLTQGWALALPYAPYGYHALERIASRQSLGVWGFNADVITRGRP
jgi:endonuclease YncB( thermonuclease family)